MRPPEVCVVILCGSPVRCGGMCTLHYSRYRRGTPLSNPPKTVNKGLICSICHNPDFCKLLCRFHYQRKYLGLPFGAPRQERLFGKMPIKCAVLGCFGLRLARDLCSLHWQRLKAGIQFDLPPHFNWIYKTGWRCRDKYKKVSIDGRGVSEHIVVAEKRIGRRLLPNEVVHHADFNKENNDPSNLEVMTRSNHTKLHNLARRILREQQMSLLP